MGKEWPYSQIVKRMSEFGGPERFIRAIEKAAYAKGGSDVKKKLTVPLLIIGASFGSVATLASQKIKKDVNRKKAEIDMLEQESNKAKCELKRQLSRENEEVEDIVDNDAD